MRLAFQDKPMRPQGRPDGVRFKLYPTPPAFHPGQSPEVVAVATRPGAVGPGPSDGRMYVVHPLGKTVAYGAAAHPGGRPVLVLPPWRGLTATPAAPGPDGHFDHLDLASPGFEAAHIFGSVAFVMDIWQSYAGLAIPWHFAAAYTRLEISILPDLDNAHAGYGYLEIGAHHDDEAVQPYGLNFDVVAHETGHLIIYSLVGVPRPAAAAGEYFGFHESAADMAALIAALHFDRHVDRLLETTRGNLYTFNELNRFAELSDSTQIRLASNTATMMDFAAGWSDEHALSQPLTGALFDILVDMFQDELVRTGVIGADLADLSRRLAGDAEAAALLQPAFDAAYAARPEAFRAALLEARDVLGFTLAETWKRLPADFFSYGHVAATLLAVESARTGGLFRRAFNESFAWRGIGRVPSGPRLEPPRPDSHTHSARTLVPERVAAPPPLARRRPRLAGCRCGTRGSGSMTHG
jgi:hypothetical protein